jgi:hypothetical protein
LSDGSVIVVGLLLRGEFLREYKIKNKQSREIKKKLRNRTKGKRKISKKKNMGRSVVKK